MKWFRRGSQVPPTATDPDSSSAPPPAASWAESIVPDAAGQIADLAELAAETVESAPAEDPDPREPPPPSITITRRQLRAPHSWRHATSLTKWHVAPGVFFRRGDALYEVAHHRSRLLPAARRPPATTTGVAEADGILLAIHLPCGQLHPGAPLAEYVLLAEWEAFTTLLQTQEETITAWRSSGRLTTGAPAPAELAAERARLQAQSRHCHEQELPARRREHARLTAAIAKEQCRAARLERICRARQTQAEWQHAAGGEASLAQLIAHPPPADGRELPPALLQAVRERLHALLAPALPLPPDDLIRLGAHGKSAVACAAAFARFAADCQAVREDPALDDSERRARWKKLRWDLRKAVNTAGFPGTGETDPAGGRAAP